MKPKLANMSGLGIHNGKRIEHIYVCYLTQNQLIEMFDKINKRSMSLSYFNAYASKGCWGKDMEHITPEIGIWYLYKDGTIEKVV